jgi:uncharacterized protein YndB with AHSA1/START domain
MEIVKIVLLGIVGIIALLLIIGLFLKKDMAVEKEVTINSSKQTVFDYIKLLKNQDNFSKWGSMDPSMQKTYTGTDGTVGFISAWVGNKKVGEGEQEILKIEEGKRIDFALRFKKPMKSLADAYMITNEISANETQVKWGFSSKMIYPFNVMCLFMNMEEMVGKDFQIGLDNLKKVMEK